MQLQVVRNPWMKIRTAVSVSDTPSAMTDANKDWGSRGTTIGRAIPQGANGISVALMGDDEDSTCTSVVYLYDDRGPAQWVAGATWAIGAQQVVADPTTQAAEVSSLLYADTLTIVDAARTNANQGWANRFLNEIDAGTVNACVGTFSIANRRVAGQMCSSSIEAYTDTTNFTLTTGEASANNDAYNGCTIIVTDQVTKIQKGIGHISDYVGATRAIVLHAAPLQTAFTWAVGDSVEIFAAAAFANVNTIGQTAQTANDNGADINSILTGTITNAAGADIATDIKAVKAETVLIVADTGELQVDDYPTSIAAVQTTVDAIETAVITNATGVDVAADIIAVKAETAAIQVETTAIDTLTKAAGNGDLAAILVDTGTTLQGELDAIQAATITNAAGVDIAADIIAVKAETAAIVADTNELQGDDYPTSIAAVKAETALIVADTNELQTDLANGGRLDLLIDAIKVVTDNMAAAATTMITGTVSWDNTNATTTVVYSDDITEATADHYNGRLFVPTSGALLGQYTAITDYALDTGEGKFTVTALTEAPADNTTFVIL